VQARVAKIDTPLTRAWHICTVDDGVKSDWGGRTRPAYGDVVLL
jgi:hypothetical protein